MGICVHCMQPKPITANKCPYCHERTGLIASTFWTVFHFVVKVTVIVVCVTLVYQCSASSSAEYPTEQSQK